MKLGRSGLTVRELQANLKPAFELTPKKVAQWIKDLPVANLGDSCKSIYRLLVDSNQMILDADKRLAILNTIEPLNVKLVHSLEKQFINNHIALTDKQKKIAALIQAIHTEFSIGYHTVIESIITDEVKWSNKKLLANALTHATHYHGQVIFRCYKLYASVPKRLWHELYQLFKIAREHEVENTNTNLSALTQETCVYAEFIQVLLLSVANPYQLRQREIELLWQLLPSLTDKVTLKGHAYNKQHYVVVLDSSSPPLHKSLFKHEKTEQVLKLTTTTAIEHLKIMLATIQSTDQNSSRKSMLLRHLIHCWNNSKHRSFARTSCDGELDICFGLSATHYLLKQTHQALNRSGDATDSPLERMEGSLKNATLTDVSVNKRDTLKPNSDYLSSTSSPGNSVWNKFYQTEDEIADIKKRNETVNRSRETIVRENYKMQKVGLLNISPSGYCIEIAATDVPKHAQTGEILGIIENQEQALWSIGVVRWVRRQLKTQTIQMGVQLLAPGVTPIDIQLRNSKTEQNSDHRALLLPALTGIGQPATLLCNPLSFSINAKVRVKEVGSYFDARLNKELMGNSNFKQFTFDVIKHSAQENDKTKASKSDDNQSFWDIF
ncbi:hypothetical protein ACUR5C_12480 [Aliikangiella sp. IMCC44653]